jgi:hypothetical protein
MRKGKTMKRPRGGHARGVVAGAAALVLASPVTAQDLTAPGVRAEVVVQTPESDVATRGSPTVSEAGARIRQFDHLGFRLGMTVEEAKAVRGFTLEDVRPADQDRVLRYREGSLETADGVAVRLRFDREDRLYLVESTQTLRPGIGQLALKQRVEAKYGPADVAGRLGLGQYRVGYEAPEAQLDVFADIALAGRDAPTTIQVVLLDRALQAGNEAAFRAEVAGEDVPAPARPPDLRVKL